MPSMTSAWKVNEIFLTKVDIQSVLFYVYRKIKGFPNKFTLWLFEIMISCVGIRGQIISQGDKRALLVLSASDSSLPSH